MTQTHCVIIYLEISVANNGNSVLKVVPLKAGIGKKNRAKRGYK